MCIFIDFIHLIPSLRDFHTLDLFIYAIRSKIRRALRAMQHKNCSSCVGLKVKMYLGYLASSYVNERGFRLTYICLSLYSTVWLISKWRKQIWNTGNGNNFPMPPRFQRASLAHKGDWPIRVSRGRSLTHIVLLFSFSVDMIPMFLIDLFHIDNNQVKYSHATSGPFRTLAKN